MRFRLVPKLMTLDDLKRALRIPLHKTCVFGVYNENFNEDRSYYRQRRCRPMTIVSRNISFVCIFVLGGSLERGRQTTME